MRQALSVVLLVTAALLAFMAHSFAGGNELMYSQIQNLPALTATNVDPTADYIPVYDASAGVTKKVLASSAAAARAPITLAVTTVLDSTYCGKLVLMSGAGSARTFTLPAATGTGCRIRFQVLAVNTSNYIITHAGSDAIKGGVVFGGDNASNGVTGFETQSAVTVTLNGTTTGGAGIGDELDFDDIGSALWSINGRATESGSEATPFS